MFTIIDATKKTALKINFVYIPRNKTIWNNKFKRSFHKDHSLPSLEQSAEYSNRKSSIIQIPWTVQTTPTRSPRIKNKPSLFNATPHLPFSPSFPQESLDKLDGILEEPTKLNGTKAVNGTNGGHVLNGTHAVNGVNGHRPNGHRPNGHVAHGSKPKRAKESKVSNRFDPTSFVSTIIKGNQENEQTLSMESMVISGDIDLPGADLSFPLEAPSPIHSVSRVPFRYSPPKLTNPEISKNTPLSEQLSLLNEFVQYKQYNKMDQVLDIIPPSEISINTYIQILSLYMERRKPEKLITIFQRMNSLNLPTKKTYSLLLNHFSNECLREPAELVINAMLNSLPTNIKNLIERDGWPNFTRSDTLTEKFPWADAEAFNSAIKMYVSLNDRSAYLKMWRMMMIHPSSLPNGLTYNTLSTQLVAMSNLPYFKDILNELEEAPFDKHLSTNLLFYYVNTHQNDEVLRILTIMDHLDCSPDRPVYNEILRNILFSISEFEEETVSYSRDPFEKMYVPPPNPPSYLHAIQVILFMIKNEITPKLSLCNSVLRAAASDLHLPAVIFTLRLMRTFELGLDKISVDILVDLFIHLMQIESIKKIVNWLKATPIPIFKRTYFRLSRFLVVVWESDTFIKVLELYKEQEGNLDDKGLFCDFVFGCMKLLNNSHGFFDNLPYLGHWTMRSIYSMVRPRQYDRNKEKRLNVRLNVVTGDNVQFDIKVQEKELDPLKEEDIHDEEVQQATREQFKLAFL